MTAKAFAKKTTREKVKEELLNSLKDNDKVEEPEINIVNVSDPGEAITIINCYDKTIKTLYKRVIGCVAKQRQILKTAETLKNLSENTEQSGSTIYFKLGIYFKKHPALRNSTLPSSIDEITSPFQK